MSGFHFYGLNQFKVIPLARTLRTIYPQLFLWAFFRDNMQYNIPPRNFLRRRMWVDGTADNANINQSQAVTIDY